MCIFSGAIRAVSSTRIFARLDGDGRQVLVYQMRVATDRAVAMVLPLPVDPARNGDDAVAFVDLSHYPKFFADLAEAFPEPRSFGRGMMAAAQLAAPRPTLAVHAVGDFVASYVPRADDFARLDPQFRLPASVLADVPAYADHGFAVFQLAPHALDDDPPPPPRRRWWWPWGRPPAAPFDPDAGADIHPMALTFPTRHADALFFPTLHVHDGGRVPREATFDHALYCQSDDARLVETFAWRRSDGNLGRHVDNGRARGTIAAAAPAFRTQLYGTQRNVDHVFAPPRCTPAKLAHAAPYYRFQLAATAAYYTVLDTAENRARQHTARAHLDALADGLVAGLDALVAEHRDAWQLVPLAGNDDPSIFLVNNRPHALTERGPVELADRAIALSFSAETPRVERQSVRLAFATPPPLQVHAAIEHALAQLLERALPAE